MIAMMEPPTLQPKRGSSSICPRWSMRLTENGANLTPAAPKQATCQRQDGSAKPHHRFQLGRRHDLAVDHVDDLELLAV
jgi:hypothetical protein